MKRFLIVAISAVVIILGIVGWVVGSTSHSPLPMASAWTPPTTTAPDLTAKAPDMVPRKTMRAFRSARELKAYFHKLEKKQLHRNIVAPSVMPAAPAPQSTSSVNGYSNGAVQTSEAKVAVEAQESVTNVQHAGVDEGAIVKLHGDNLVVLRRGRLFTIAINDGALTPISSINAFGPDIDPAATWYDEMLVSEDTVVVIGYSYAGGGTEVGLFQIDPAGKLTYRSTYHLRSDDYYSSRNYASRLIGSRLIFYTPLPIIDLDNPFQSLPAVRRWHKGATESEFHRIASSNRIYRPEHAIETDYQTVLHTVTICDLSGGKFACKATSVVGPSGEAFYVSPKSVYVWVTEEMPEGEQTRAKSMVYRMPLDGSAPSALRVSGSPVDQFSFLESEDGHLNVLVGSEATGNGMWNGESAAGDVALMRVPLKSFSDGTAAAPFSSYRKLPTPVGDTFQNRFVGDYLLYGTGSGWGVPQKADHPSLYAVRWAGGAPHELALTHGVDRIEQMGSDAVVIGVDGNNLHFTAIRLGDWPEMAGEYVREDASQGELRSQGFFYKPDSENSGMLGLPISVAGRPGYKHLIEDSAAILFLKNDSLHFQEVGELAAHPEKSMNDGCRASCVDWYGNSRPLFVRGRIIAMLGYELVEGKIDDGGRIQELRRVSYAPQSLTAVK